MEELDEAEGLNKVWCQTGRDGAQSNQSPSVSLILKQEVRLKLEDLIVYKRTFVESLID